MRLILTQEDKQKVDFLKHAIPTLVLALTLSFAVEYYQEYYQKTQENELQKIDANSTTIPGPFFTPELPLEVSIFDKINSVK